MDMPQVIVMLGVLLVVLVALPLVAILLLAGREGRDHRSRKVVREIATAAATEQRPAELDAAAPAPRAELS